MQYIVAGGAGFIGSTLVDKLLEDSGNKVIVLDNFSTGRDENLGSHKTNKHLSIIKKNIYGKLDVFHDGQVDALFHLAAITNVQYSMEHPTEVYNSNISGTVKLLDYCEKHGIKRFIFSSSSSVYGNQDKLPFTEDMKPNPISPYATSKLLGEHCCRSYGTLYNLETISLRYFNVYGPRQNPAGDYACLIPKFIKIIENGDSPAINGSGDQTRDFVYVQDVVNANILASNLPKESLQGDAINIGYGRGYSVNDVTERLIKLCGKEIKPLHGPPVTEPKDTLAGIEKAKELLGWEPATSFDEGLREIYKFFSI